MGKTFKHSGDLGDIVFSLPTVRALGGGILYLDPEGGRNDPVVSKSAFGGATRLRREGIGSLRTLLERQPYIEGVREWKGEAVDYDLDLFRKHVGMNNLSDMHLKVFGLPAGERDRAWLENVEAEDLGKATYVLSRTVRYQANYGFWESIIGGLAERAVFVGLAKEHEIFEYTFGVKVAYRETKTIYELARVIAGGKQFIGNASLPHAIAEGMKKPLIAEVYRVAPRIIFLREGAQYV